MVANQEHVTITRGIKRIGRDVAHPQALKKVTKDYEGNSSALTEDTVVNGSPIQGSDLVSGASTCPSLGGGSSSKSVESSAVVNF